MTRHGIQFVVFDLDDTLYPEQDFVRSGFGAVDRWVHEKQGITGFGERAWCLFLGGQRKRIFDQVLQGLGFACGGDIVEQLVRVYREHRPHIQLFRDVNAALEQLRGIKQLGLLTDGYLPMQHNKVVALDLTKWFDHVLCTETLGRDCWKPSSVPYQKIAKDAKCCPAQCVYVGDNPAKDFVTARRLGWHTIRVRRDETEHFRITLDRIHEADVEMESLADLGDCLSKF